MITKNINMVTKEVKPGETSKVVRKGYVQAMHGNEIWVNTETDEMMKIVINDKDTRWKLYCKRIKVTIEVVDEK